MTLQIKGLQKMSLADYSPYTSCVVFLSGCNFRCGFCHNPDLLVEIDKTPTIPEDSFFSFLEKRKKWLDGVVITGGEPCLYEELPDFIKKIKEMGYKVKLYTNGTKPEMVKGLINGGLIDSVSMDIKGSLENYDKAANVKVDKDKINESVKVIMGSNIDNEFRMTCVPKLVSKEDFKNIGEWLKGCKRFYIQQFSNKVCLDSSFEKIEPFSNEELREFKGILAGYIDNVDIIA